MYVQEGQVFGDTKYIDPQAEILKATGRLLDRGMCILDFASGIKASGCVVWIDERRKGRLYSFKAFIDYSPTGFYSDYYMFGLLWGRGQWNLLKDGFARDVPLRDQTYTLGTLVDAGIIRV
ncbi:MAG: hypothetical protein WC813_02825 [Patescibacteria group bacterium]